MTAAWTVTMAFSDTEGSVRISTCDVPDELSARRMVDICRLLPAVISAHAQPLDVAPTPATVAG